MSKKRVGQYKNAMKMEVRLMGCAILYKKEERKWN